MNAKKTGEFIQGKRKAKNITQQELADLLNVTNKAVSRWETGEGYPDITLLPQLSVILGCTTDELLQGEDLNTKEKRSNIPLKNYSTYLSISLLFMTLIAIIISFATYSESVGSVIIILALATVIIAYLFLRSKYLTVCIWSDEERKYLFISTAIFYCSIIASFTLFAPIIYSALFINSIYAKSIITLKTYFLMLVLTLPIGLIAGVISVLLHHRKVYKKPIRKFLLIILLASVVVILGIFVRAYYFQGFVVGILALSLIFAIVFRKKYNLSTEWLIFIGILLAQFIIFWVSEIGKFDFITYKLNRNQPLSSTYYLYVAEAWYCIVSISAFVVSSIYFIVNIIKKKNVKLNIALLTLIGLFALLVFYANGHGICIQHWY